MRYCVFMRYYYTFPCAIPLLWAGYSRVTHPSATVLNHLHPERFRQLILVRLACVRHAASVRPEPGSNSRLNLCFRSFYPFRRLACLKFAILRQIPCQYMKYCLRHFPCPSNFLLRQSLKNLSFPKTIYSVHSV